MEIATGIFLFVVCIILIFAYSSYLDNVKFKLWYAELLEKAPAYGFNTHQIDQFEIGDFWNYYSDDMSPEDALKTYLLED